MATVNPPRGMRDFIPAEKSARDRVLAIIRESYRANGFDEIETPVVEESSRLSAGLGGDNETLAFGILKRGLSTDDIAAATSTDDLVDMGLRYDLTVPLTRFYATNRAELPPVFRAIQIAPVWRAERPQKGRFRQFVQCDIDIIGEPGILAEVELITATAATLDRLGVTGTTIRLNDRRILFGMLDALGLSDTDSALITLDKLDKIGADGVIAELRERGATDSALAGLETLLGQHSNPTSAPTLAAMTAALPAGVAPVAVAELADIAAAVGHGVSIVFDPFLVRGMGYYTGAIFEVAHPDLGYSLGGGGRYDGMIGRFLGTEVPAAGISLGFERLVDLVATESVVDSDAVAIIYDPALSTTELIDQKRSLIAEGLRVRLVHKTKNTRAILDQLEKDGFRRYAFLNPGEPLEWKTID
ncbi:MAG: histidine--tRNA ligase [Actinobacteria bacterium]|uniref:histidine--tRNA ligase n=1 Tax=freshwater metagenome TaxID=449393 RepID=A0A6J7CMS8_9ZZZZ|nr:histidine--tRNA ligase [Actinomycetota bacterium]